MSNAQNAAKTAQKVGVGAGRLVRASRALPRERRPAAFAALGLFLTLFLPWYQRQFFVVVAGKLQPGSDSQNAWQAFSFVEAAVLLVAIGVLTLLFQRAEGRPFHLPGGDGWVITAAGFWTCVLVIWRIFDKQGGTAHGQNATTYGIEWGIFIALAVAGFLAYSGNRIRAAHESEPPLPGEPGYEGTPVSDGPEPPRGAPPGPPESRADPGPPEPSAPPGPPESRADPGPSEPSAPPGPPESRADPGPPEPPATLQFAEPRAPARPRPSDDDQLTIPLDDQS